MHLYRYGALEFLCIYDQMMKISPYTFRPSALHRGLPICQFSQDVKRRYCCSTDSNKIWWPCYDHD